jgi:hypothetical protein
MPIYTVGVSGTWHGHMIVEAPDADKAEALADLLPVPDDARIEGFEDMTVDDVEERGDGDGLCACRCGCAAVPEIVRKDVLTLCVPCEEKHNSNSCALASWTPEDGEIR